MNASKKVSFFSAFAFLTLFVPDAASALTIPQLLGLFHIAVGILLTITLGVFIQGVALWIARFNTWPSHRETAIRILEWAIVMLFVLLLLIAFVYFVQRHTTIAFSILSVGIIIGAIALAVKVMGGGEGGGGAESKGKSKGGH